MATTESTLSRIVGRLLPFLLGLGVVGAFCLRQIAEADLGWHVALGKVVADHGIPYTNALCWPALDHPWFSNSWLFDWIAWELSSHFGWGAIQLLMFTLLALVLAGVHAASLRLEPRFGGWVTPIIALLLIPRLTERPFVATWAELAWTLYLCLPEPGDSPERLSATFKRRLGALPIIAVGASLHQGAVFSAILLGVFCLESFVRAGRKPRELVLAAGGVLALFVNPGGMFGLRDSLGHINVQSQLPLNEYYAPSFAIGYPFYLLCAMTIPIALLSWRRSIAYAVALVCFGAAGAWALRFMYDAEILAAPALALGAGMLARWRGVRTAAVALATVLVLAVGLRWEWRLSLLLLGPEWNRWAVPVDGARFIQREHLTGRMFNGYWEGGYLEGVMPEQKWFQDGRPHAFPPAFFEQAKVADRSPEAFRAWMRQLDVEWAVTGMGQSFDGKHQLHSPEWALVYWDDIVEISLRRDVPRFQSLIARAEYRHFNDMVDIVPTLAVAPRAVLPEWRAELERFEKDFPDFGSTALARCAVAAREGNPRDACEAALALNGTPAWRAQVEAARAIAPAP